MNGESGSFSSRNIFRVLEGLDEEVARYLSQSDPELLDCLWEKVSEFVRLYPLLAFRERDEDIRSDFYLYIWERRRTLFDKFDSSQSSFRYYLNLRLRFHYLNFAVRERKTREKDRVVYFDQTDQFLGSAEGKNEKRDSEESSDKGSVFFPPYEKDPFSYLVLKLYYLDFFSEDDFVRLKEYTGKKYAEIMEKFDRLRDEVAEKKRRRLRIDERLGGLYWDLLSCQERSTQGGDQERGEAGEKELFERRCRLVEEYHRIQEFASLNAIGDILGANETKVANTLVYQRKVMMKKIYPESSEQL